MLERKNVFILFGGIAIGSFGTALVFKYYNKKCRKSTNAGRSLLNKISDAESWPLTDYEACKPKIIHVVSHPTDFDSILSTFIIDTNDVKVLGFDCEWTSSSNGTNPIALLQLTTSDYSCYLIRLNKLNSFIPKEILSVLQNKSILKVGVGIMDDAAKLLRDHGISVQGCLDLRAFAARYQITETRGLQSMAKELVNINLNKSRHLRCSDWDAESLSNDQTTYAAMDAFSALKIFEALLQVKFDASPPCQEDINKAAHNLAWTFIRSSIQGLVDITFKEKKRLKSTKCEDLKSNNNGLKNMKGMPKNPKLYKSMKPHSTRFHSRQQPLYDNCKLQAPDGQLLSTCDRKKALWYMEKNLAELICEDPLTIRLYFEPSGRPDDDRDYYLYEKENKCVVCGSTESFVRKNVIPHEYRKHFALAMKDHTSHDILLLCLPCHQQSNYYDCLLRRQLAEEFKAPQGSIQAARMFEDPERRSVRSAGRALQNSKNKLPENRKRELDLILAEFFNVDDVTDEIISEACELETRVENEAYVPHGEKVVLSIFKDQGTQGMLDFERRWREHFLKNMQPKYLPVLWSVDHNHAKVKKRINEMEDEYKAKLNSKAMSFATK
ncbi:exonuclease 3'-5' domain-containing protein 2-like isoform X1 [Styela clava]